MKEGWVRWSICPRLPRTFPVLALKSPHSRKLLNLMNIEQFAQGYFDFKISRPTCQETSQSHRPGWLVTSHQLISLSIPSCILFVTSKIHLLDMFHLDHHSSLLAGFHVFIVGSPTLLVLAIISNYVNSRVCKSSKLYFLRLVIYLICFETNVSFCKNLGVYLFILLLQGTISGLW